VITTTDVFAISRQQRGPGAAGMLMFHVDIELPAYGALAPIGGTRAPLTVSGMLV